MRFFMLVSTIIDFFFPPHKDVLIVRGLSETDVRDKLIIQHKPEPWIVTGFSYRTPAIRALIRANKFHADTKSATLLGLCLSDIVLSILEENALSVEWREVLLIPVPSSSMRSRKRGYSQVERIVEKALPFIKDSIHYQPNLLKRTDRPSQVRVSRTERAHNVAESFFVSNEEVKKILSDSYCILVDDVSETGATLADARRALLRAGVKEVIGVAIAH